MFGCIYPEARNTDVNQITEVVCNFLPDARTGAVQIREANQVAVAHILRVAIIVHITYVLQKVV